VSLEEEIVRRIRAGGPLPFAAFMSLALYDPSGGYYSGHVRTGWRGHFLTSPELDPAFGRLWAVAFREVWVRSGQPSSFEIVEIGPGEGGFARAVLGTVDDDLHAALTYRLVERVPAARTRQESLLEGAGNIEWTASITELPEIEHGCVFANEVLDNLPVHLVEAREGEIVELCVGEGDAGLELVARPVSNPELEAFLERTGTTPPDGARAEVALAGESFIARVTGRLGRGAVFLVDYGLEGAEIARRGGTLLTYSDKGVDDDVLERPGEKDITAHANWTSARRALEAAGMTVTGPTEQRKVLLSLGARDVDARLKEKHDTAISEGRGADAVTALSARQSLGALLDPGGLGGLQVLAGYRGIAPLDLGQ
jgi:SAM-dependent MidA family methyltransferase